MDVPDTGTRSQFNTGAQRDGMEGKGMPSLLPVFPLWLLSKRLEDGAKKYGRDNWRKGIPLSRYVDGLHRHLWKWMLGWEDEDHEGALLFNVVGLVQTAQDIREGKLPMDLDDLPDGPIRNQLICEPKNWVLRQMYKTTTADPYKQTEFDFACQHRRLETPRPPKAGTQRHEMPAEEPPLFSPNWRKAERFA